MKLRNLAVSAAVLFCITVPVYANSGMTFWEGTDNTGVMTSDSDCPLTVTHEDLDLYIEDLPETRYDSREDFLSYNSSLKAEYTFYNPSDMHVKAVLSFPLGKMPMYAYYDPDKESYDPAPEKIAGQYGILINGKKTDVQLRGTFMGYDGFDFKKDITVLKDSCASHPFYRFDMPVTHYEFRIDDVDEKETAAAIKCRFEADSSKTKLIFRPFNGGTFTDEYSEVQIWADEGKADLYVIGEDLASVPEWKVVRSGDNDTEIAGEVTLISRDMMTLGEYVLSEYDGSWGIPETDYYNAWIEMMGQSGSPGLVAEEFDLYSGMMLYWYQYAIELDPHESLVNTVTAPLYLSIDTGYEEPVYSYTYYLSPASTWKEFGTLDISLHTDLNLLKCIPEQSEKTDDGYRISLPGLPEGELEFSVCTVQDPKKKPVKSMFPLPYLIVFAAVIIGLIILIRRK